MRFNRGVNALFHNSACVWSTDRNTDPKWDSKKMSRLFSLVFEKRRGLCSVCHSEEIVGRLDQTPPATRRFTETPYKNCSLRST
jgi:hypothetical protein